MLWLGACTSRRKSSQIGDDLPALLFWERTPRRHAFVGIAVLEHPRQVAVCGMANARTAQAGTAAPGISPIGVSAMTFGAVLGEERFAGCRSLRLMPQRIGTSVIFVRDTVQPFAVELAGRAHVRAHLSKSAGGHDRENDDETHEWEFGLHYSFHPLNISRLG